MKASVKSLGKPVEKKLTPKQKKMIETMKKACEVGGKAFKEGKLKPL